MFQQVGDGPLPTMAVARFVKETVAAGPFREIVGLYAQANHLQMMQSAACNALHGVKQRCCRWLLQTHDRVGADDFPLKHEFLAVMLGVRRPTVTVVLRSLQQAGLISSRYGRIRILKRKKLERASCECYERGPRTLRQARTVTHVRSCCVPRANLPLVLRATSDGVREAQASGAALARAGSGRATKKRRQGRAIRRAQRFARFTRALSVAMPVLAYICR